MLGGGQGAKVVLPLGVRKDWLLWLGIWFTLGYMSYMSCMSYMWIISHKSSVEWVICNMLYGSIWHMSIFHRVLLVKLQVMVDPWRGCLWLCRSPGDLGSVGEFPVQLERWHVARWEKAAEDHDTYMYIYIYIYIYIYTIYIYIHIWDANVQLMNSFRVF